MKISTKEIILCGLFASITGILSQISIPIPFTTVPLTMQVFAVLICGMILGPKLGFISQIIYIIIGAIGIPVYSQMSAGIGIMLGPTGGFIISFPIVASLVGYFSKAYKTKTMIVLGMLLAILISYIIGTLQFCAVTQLNFVEGLMACVIPFIGIDILKIVMAYGLGTKVNKRIKQGVI